MTHMPMMSPVTMALTTVAMMVAMMLPSVAPTLWRHHRQLRAMRAPRAGIRAMLVVVGYAGVWTAIGLALSALSPARVAPWMAGAVVLCAGALQRSRWKADRLLRCRTACVAPDAVSKSIMAAWRVGCRLGIDCSLSCAAPMAVLLVSGLMDARMMAVVTAAITAERVAPGGARIARLTGGLALITGLVMCAQTLSL